MKRLGDITDETEGGRPLKELMEKPIARRSLLKTALAATPMLVLGPSLLKLDKAQAATNIGPSTQTEPYLVPTVPGVNFTSILTTGDKVGTYRMVGIPDGLGAFNTSRTTFTVLMNHHRADEPRNHQHQAGHRARARQQRRVRLALAHRSQDAAGVEGRGLNAVGA